MFLRLEVEISVDVFRSSLVNASQITSIENRLTDKSGCARIFMSDGRDLYVNHTIDEITEMLNRGSKNEWRLSPQF